MADNQLEIGIIASSNFGDVMEKSIAATKELTSSINALNTILNTNTGASEAMAKAMATVSAEQQKVVETQAKATSAIKENVSAQGESSAALKSTADATKLATEAFSNYEKQMISSLATAEKLSQKDPSQLSDAPEKYGKLADLLRNAIEQRRLLTEEELKAAEVSGSIQTNVGLPPTADGLQRYRDMFKDTTVATTENTAAQREGLSAAENMAVVLKSETKDVAQLRDSLESLGYSRKEATAAANMAYDAEEKQAKATQQTTEAINQKTVATNSSAQASASKATANIATGENPEDAIGKWLPVTNYIAKATNDIKFAMNTFHAAIAEGLSPSELKLSTMTGQMEGLDQIAKAGLSAGQALRYLRGESLETILAEQGLKEVSLSLVNAQANQAKIAGDLAGAREILNKALTTGVLTETEKVKLSNEIATLEQKELAANKEKISATANEAQARARLLVAQKDYAAAETVLQAALKETNLEQSKKLAIETQLANTTRAKESFAVAGVKEDLSLAETNSKNAAQLKDYAAAIGYLEQAKINLNLTTEQQIRIDTQMLALQQKKQSAASQDIADGVALAQAGARMLAGQGDFVKAEELLNIALKETSLSLDQQIALQTQLSRISKQDIAKGASTATEFLGEAEAAAKVAVASNDLAKAIQILTDAKKILNTTNAQQLKLDAEILTLKDKQSAQVAQEIAESLKLAEEQAQIQKQTGNLTGAIETLTNARKDLNLSGDQNLRISREIIVLNNQKRDSDVASFEALGRGAMQAKDYASAIKYYTQAVEASVPGTKQAIDATNLLEEAQRRAATSSKGAGSEIHNSWSSSFVFFGAAMEVNAALQQMAAASGETASKNMTQFGKVAQEVASGALMGAMVPGLGAVGVLVGALSGLLLGLGIAMFTVDEKTAALNKQLDSLAKKDDLSETLAKIGNMTYQDAEAMLALAKASPEAAKALQQYVDASKEITGAEKLTSVIAMGWQTLGDSIKEAGVQIDLPTTKVLSVLFSPQAIQWLDSAVKKYDDIRAAQAAYQKGVIGRQEADKQFVDLQSTLAPAEKKDNGIDALQQMTGLSQTKAETVLKEVGTQKELGSELARNVRIYTETLTQIEKIADAGERAKAKAILDSGWGAAVKNTAEQILANAKDTVDTKIASADAKGAVDQVKNEQTKYYALIDAEKKYGDDKVKIGEETAKKMADIAYNEAQMELKYRQDLARAQRDLDDNLAKAAQTLADKEADIQRGLADKQASESESYRKKVQDIEQSLIKSHEDYAKKIADIDRKEIQDLANLSWQTGQDLNKSKTDNEREAINERAVHERAVIRQRATDDRSDAARKLAEEEELSTKKKHLALEEYNYKRGLDQQNANQQIADARRAFEEQTADARKRNAEQLADMAQQHKTAEDGVRRQRALEEQASRDRLKELQVQHQTELQMIQARYIAEIQMIIERGIEARKQWAETLGILSSMTFGQYSTAESKYVSDEILYRTNPEKYEQIANARKIPGKAMGGAVDSGMPYWVGEQGRELFVPSSSGTIVPHSSTSNYGGNNISFVINGATDPKAVGEEVRKMLEQEIWR